MLRTVATTTAISDQGWTTSQSQQSLANSYAGRAGADYVSIGMAALLCYDYLLTSGREVNIMWRDSNALPVLFIANRCVMVAMAVLNFSSLGEYTYEIESDNYTQFLRSNCSHYIMGGILDAKSVCGMQSPAVFTDDNIGSWGSVLCLLYGNLLYRGVCASFLEVVSPMLSEIIVVTTISRRIPTLGNSLDRRTSKPPLASTLVRDGTTYFLFRAYTMLAEVSDDAQMSLRRLSGTGTEDEHHTADDLEERAEGLGYGSDQEHEA
ncbi:hypothetical protein WOLCODRAFT_21190 [Wolfiporia cocos MD-104 SS10]|uniref:DUF6533 domain-containing protein n=1 Tax=Wolfiporia cocos (strain MD-104) TaxID=742152 RepID=A0A2H3JJ64_WOLCO|nr:hypothetical protein WOLCODRAFT_21190 [Wolfiporia cocos MD-104 SS10]